MKKLSLGKLNLVSEEVLQRSQLAKVYGGSDGCRIMYCQCIGSVGAWEAEYCTAQEAVDAIKKWCASGDGHCV